MGNAVNGVGVLPEFRGHFRLYQPHRARWVEGLEPHIEPGLTAAQDQRLLGVVPLEGPNQRPCPYMDRKPSGYDGPRIRGIAVKAERRHLRYVDRFVRHEHVRRCQLQDRPVRMSPYFPAGYLEHTLQIIALNRRHVLGKVPNHEPFAIQATTELKIVRTGYLENSGLVIDDRRAERRGFRVLRRGVFTEQRPG